MKLLILSIAIILLQIAFIYSTPIDSSLDRIAADKICAQYRTGELDPVISQIPRNTQTNVFINPEEYLPLLVDFLVSGAENDFIIVKRIHDWITDNIAYDDDLFYGINTGSRQTYELLKLKRTTCSGYSRLFLEMAELAEIEAVYISGYAKTYLMSNGEQGNHVWNAVKINNNWYIVDTTHDRRFTYFNGELGEKEDYNDTELFISPEAKILVNYPENEEYQFLDNPYTLEEFIAESKFRVNFLNYNISMITDLNGLTTEYLEERPGGKLQGVYDGIETRRNVIEIKIQCPDNVKLLCNMFDKEGNKVREYTFNYRENNTAVCMFSAPEAGVFRAYIYAKFTDIDNSWKTVYGFRLIELSGKGPELPFPDRIYKNSNYYTYGLDITDHNISAVNTAGYYKLEILHPEDVSVVSSLRDENNNRIEDSLEVSVLGNTRTYYYSLPSNGIYYIKVYAKYLDEEDHNTSVTIKLINTEGQGVSLPPQDAKIFYSRFEENGFRYISDNISIRSRNDPYIVTIECPQDFTMNCRTRDSNDNTVINRHAYSRNGNTYTFYFSAPGDSGLYTARIYQIDNTGTWNSLVKFNMNSSTDGPLLPMTNILLLKNTFYDYNLTLMYSNVNITFGNDTYVIKIDCDYDIDMAASLRDQDDNLVREHYIYERANNTYTFYFSSPGGGPYYARIYAKYKDAEKYDYTNAEFIISSSDIGETFR